MSQFESKKIRYASADTPQQVYKQIRERADDYFKSNKLPKHGTLFMAAKAGILVVLIVIGYALLTQVHTFLGALIAYFLLTFAALILSINLGHDAAHHAITGNQRFDDFIFQAIFAIQGLSGYVWQIRHNYSHHVLPNVREHDSDMEITPLILLEPDNETVRWYHKYQHIYATFLYTFVSFHLLFVQDFKFFTMKDQANLHFERIPLIEWVKMIGFKIGYFLLTFAFPLHFGHIDFEHLVLAWAIVHMIVSVFVAYTFYISHHVTELHYVGSGEKHDLVSDSWIHHQITTTIDFEPDNRLADFLFGGFNLHIAHHVFPEVCHEHYPALTRLIREVLDANGCSDWYKSYSFTEGCVSHLRHLKNVAWKAFNEEPEPEFLTTEPTPAFIYENSHPFNS